MSPYKRRTKVTVTGGGRPEPARALAALGSHIILGPDGTVLAITGPWPQDLVNTRFQDCQALPAQLREAGARLLERSPCSDGRMAVQAIVPDDASEPVRLVVIEAIPMRRRDTDVRTLLTSKLAVIVSQAAIVDVAFTIVVADDVPAVVPLDAEKVAWAVTTLVGNALRYLQSGLRKRSGRTIEVRVNVDRGPQLTIEVADNGMGIPADTVARIFKRDGLDVRGAGLSLLLMADICAAHGGTADLRSQTGVADHGTTVRLTFPL